MMTDASRFDLEHVTLILKERPWPFIGITLPAPRLGETFTPERFSRAFEALAVDEPTLALTLDGDLALLDDADAGFDGTGLDVSDSADATAQTGAAADPTRAPLAVSRAFRTSVLRTLPAAATNEAYLRFVELLLSPPYRDVETRQILIGAPLLARIEGVRHTKHYVALDFLRRIEQEMLPGLSWSESIFYAGDRKGKTRQVRTTGLPESITDEFAQEMAVPVGQRSGLVEFVSGTPIRVRDGVATERALKHAQASAPGHPATRQVADYLNRRRPNLFARLVKANAPATRAACVRLYGSDSAHLAQIDAIERQPQVFYGPSRSGHTARVIAQGTSMLQLPRPLRSEMTRGWVWFDLALAQLAIVTTTWGVEALRPYLTAPAASPEKSLWDEFLGSLGREGEALVEAKAAHPERYADAKGAIKNALYATIYGAARSRVEALDIGRRREGRPALASKLATALGFEKDARHDLGRVLTSHAVFRLLFAARARQMAALSRGGIPVDCFGVPIGDGTLAPHRVLALQAQAIELALMLPLVDLADQSGGAFQIPLWLHDGVAVAFSDASKQARWTERIMAAVIAEADRRGIPTRLELA